VAATTLSAIRSGLASALTTAITDAQCTGYLLASPTAPGFEIEPGETQYDQSMQRGIDEWTLIVRGFVGDASDIGSQKQLDAWLASSGALSVKAAIEASPGTLGGAVFTLRVTQVSGYRKYGTASSNVTYLGAEWTVVAHAPGV